MKNFFLWIFRIFGLITLLFLSSCGALNIFYVSNLNFTNGDIDGFCIAECGGDSQNYACIESCFKGVAGAQLWNSYGAPVFIIIGVLSFLTFAWWLYNIAKSERNNR